MKRIEQLKKAFEATTPGAWDWHLGTDIDEDDFATVEVHPEDNPEDTIILLSGDGSQADNVEFIAMARNLMPLLLEAVDLVKANCIGNPCAEALIAALDAD